MPADASRCQSQSFPCPLNPTLAAEPNTRGKWDLSIAWRRFSPVFFPFFFSPSMSPFLGFLPTGAKKSGALCVCWNCCKTRNCSVLPPQVRDGHPLPPAPLPQPGEPVARGGSAGEEPIPDRPAFCLSTGMEHEMGSSPGAGGDGYVTRPGGGEKGP